MQQPNNPMMALGFNANANAPMMAGNPMMGNNPMMGVAPQMAQFGAHGEGQTAGGETDDGSGMSQMQQMTAQQQAQHMA